MKAKFVAVESVVFVAVKIEVSPFVAVSGVSVVVFVPGCAFVSFVSGLRSSKFTVVSTSGIPRDISPPLVSSPASSALSM